MRRRTFIKSSIILATSNIALTSCQNNTAQVNKKNHISGFIFSDAHIGWKGAAQPSLQQQADAIAVIKRRFPNLDLVFDTGDLHHGYLNEEERDIARSFWLTNMVNPFSNSFFHYIPGNHELGRGPNDEELTASKIGSQNFRPYYSMDYKGIHFVSLPQLLDTILLNKESLDWLRHDLYLNKEKTTLIFSHNSIEGTTYNNGETGYRTVINSEELLEIINKHGNVVAWLHGHNHQYEIVKKDKRLYVSNGRIGGFNPPKKWGKFGQGHLGGVYFEINSEGVQVHCFSASKNQFLSQLGFQNLSHHLKVKTTFKSNAKCNYYFGHGALTNNVKHDIYHHFLSEYPVGVSSRILESSILNDNSNFDFTTELFSRGKKINRTVGYQIKPKSITKTTTNEGLLIENNSNEEIIINIPSKKIGKYNYMARASYYRCSSNDVFQLKFSFQTKMHEKKSLNKILINYFVLNREQDVLFQSKVIEVDSNNKSFNSQSIIIPELDKKSSDHEMYLKVSIKLLNFPSKIIFTNLSLSKVNIDLVKPELIINNLTYPVINGKSSQVNVNSYLNKGRSFIKYNGAKSVSCVIKISDVKWQIRNAICNYQENTIELIEYRHSYQKDNEVVLTPLEKKLFYINKTVNIMPVKIDYGNSSIRIHLTQLNHNSSLFVKSTLPLKNILGSKTFTKLKGGYQVKPESKLIEMFF